MYFSEVVVLVVPPPSQRDGQKQNIYYTVVHRVRYVTTLVL